MKTQLVILILGLSTISFAKNAKTPSIAEQATRTVSGTSGSHKFSGLTLKGQLKKPDLSYIYKRAGLRSEQIVDIPETFDHEIVQDADQF